MRNKLYKILAAGFALAITFTLSCSDDKGEDNPNGGGGSSISDLPKQTYRNGSEYKGNSEIELRIPFYKGSGAGSSGYTCTDYNGVEHECSYEESRRYESMPAGKIENGKVSLDLPESIDSKYFFRIKDAFCQKGNECSVSPENLTASSPIIYVSVSGNSECMLLPVLKRGAGEGEVYLIYTSQSGKVTGKECADDQEGVSCENYDMNFSKGWNVQYRYRIDNWNIMETTNLSKTGGTLEWQIWCSTDG